MPFPMLLLTVKLVMIFVIAIIAARVSAGIVVFLSGVFLERNPPHLLNLSFCEMTLNMKRPCIPVIGVNAT
ncbi:hypothetical protein BGZ60DRAFT_419783, partial [Tricladium varicosporioides]